MSEDWIWHNGSEGNKAGWKTPAQYYEEILKPVAQDYNSMKDGKSNGDKYYSFTFGEKTWTPWMNSTVKEVAADLKANPTYDGWKSFLPIWGSYKQAKLDEASGHNVSMYFNSIMAGSDVCLLKSVFVDGGKFLIKGGAFKSYKWWSSWRSWYGTNGFAGAGEQMHHWLWYRNGAKSGIGFDWKLTNSPWNLVTMKDSKLLSLTGSEIHTLIHGGTVNGRTWNNIYGAGMKYMYGTPTWFKTTLNFGFSKGYNSTR